MVARERRGSKRIPIKFKVDCLHEQNYLISYSKDLSPDGMFIQTESPPEVGQKITLQFPLGGRSKQEASARVVWVNTSGSQQDIGMGVKFIKPTVALKNEIMNFVKKVAVLEK